LELTHHPIFDEEDPLAWVQGELDLPESQYPLLAPYVHLYSNFVSQHMEFGAMIYSPVRGAFMNRMLRVEDYCNYREFEALAALLGPHGIRLIDRQLLQLIGQKLPEVKEIVSRNRESLEGLETLYGTDECIPYARQITDLEIFTLKGISIGNCLQFRQALYTGLQNAFQTSAPVVPRSVKALVKLYPPNLFGDATLRAGDVLGTLSGVPMGWSDPALQAIFRPIAQGDADLWKLLPYFFASTIFTSQFQNAVYKPSLDAFPNKLHVLVDTYLTSLVLFRATSGEDDDWESIRDESVARYLEVASIIVIRLLRINAKDLQKKLPFASLQSVVIFLDLFVREADQINKSKLDQVAPYSLMRSLYHDIYLAETEA